MYMKIIMPVVLLLLGPGASHAAFAVKVEVQSIQIVPVEPMAGDHPEITGTVKASSAQATGETTEIIVFASLTRPDHAVKVWTWKEIRIKAGESKVFTIPDEYKVKLKGVYKVDFTVYSKDMVPLNKLSKSFTVVEPSHPLVTMTSQETVTGTTGALSGQGTIAGSTGALSGQETVTGSTGISSAKASGRPADDQQIGVGAYVNTVNTAGGATVLFWPHKYVGLQGSYTMGEFTTAEVRLLARLPLAIGINPYFGLGYVNVATERTVDVIGIKTTFKDSGVSGVIGVEIPLRRSVFGYVEISGAAIDLKKEVTSGGLTGTADVNYSPLTVGFSIVYYVF